MDVPVSTIHRSNHYNPSTIKTKGARLLLLDDVGDAGATELQPLGKTQIQVH
jgi:hypothetical protein